MELGCDTLYISKVYRLMEMFTIEVCSVCKSLLTQIPIRQLPRTPNDEILLAIKLYNLHTSGKFPEIR